MVATGGDTYSKTTPTEEYDASGVMQREQPILDRLEDIQYSLEKLSSKVEVLSDRLYFVRADKEIKGHVEEQDLRGLSPIEVKLAEMQEFIDYETEHIRVIIETVRL